jgi:lipopolysaccharide heptosyltransferase II
MAEKYKKALIINIFGIGDVLFSTPMVRALKDSEPGARIDFMCNERGRYVLENNKNIESLIIFEKDDFRNEFRRSKIGFIKKLSAFMTRIKRGRYDLLIDLSLSYQFSLAFKFLGIKRRIGFNYRNRGKFLTDRLDMHGFNDKHVVEYYLDILKLIGIDSVTDKAPDLPVSQGLELWAEGFIRKNRLEEKTLIGIAPGGGKSWGKYAVYRRWDPKCFSYIAKKLSEKNKDAFFLIFGSQAERGISQVIAEKVGEKSINLCGKLSLPESIALIRICRLLLCNDGGILHIAVSQGVNTVSIFGPVDDKVYGPYPISGKHRVAKAEDVRCRPCYKNFKHKMCATHDCLKKIDADDVLALAEESLDTQV